MNIYEVEDLAQLAALRGCEIKQAKRHQTRPCEVCTWTIPQIGDYYVVVVNRSRCLQSYYEKQGSVEDGHIETPTKYCLDCFKKEVGYFVKFSTLVESEDVGKPSSDAVEKLDMTDILEESDYE